jgi:hypothetical protein
MKRKTIRHAVLMAAAALALGAGGPGAAAEKKPAAEPVLCMELYQPVCGSKGTATKTYSNACFAKADGAKVVSQGECPAQKPDK